MGQKIFAFALCRIFLLFGLVALTGYLLFQLRIGDKSRFLFNTSQCGRDRDSGSISAGKHIFKLKHVFASGRQLNHSAVKFLDITELNSAFEKKNNDKVNPPTLFAVRKTAIPISQARRLPTADLSTNFNNHWKNDMPDRGESIVWTKGYTNGPNVSDRETVINLAKMTSNAYVLDPSQVDWLNITFGFNRSQSFGWEEDGLRGHVFADDKNDTVIVAFKGTSIDPRNKERNRDRLNDNQLFSCCCASQRPDPYWYGPACDCQTDTYQCNSTCLTRTLIHKGHYYPTALEVMQNVSLRYPDANLWVVGHSMGGAMASLMGLTYNIPAVSFEAPPQKLAAQRLGLQVPPETGAFHFGNTADPIYMGACHGFFSTCSAAGYAFESQCFTGKRCVYDTVGDKGWHLSIANHRINTFIKEVLEKYDNVTNCEIDDECVDCYNWDFNL